MEADTTPSPSFDYRAFPSGRTMKDPTQAWLNKDDHIDGYISVFKTVFLKPPGDILLHI